MVNFSIEIGYFMIYLKQTPNSNLKERRPFSIENFNEFMDAVDVKNAYRNFIDKNSDHMEAIFTNLHNYINNTFHHGFAAGKEKGILDGELKAKMKVIINLIKFTEMDDRIIFKIAEIKEDDDRWIRVVKETRQKMKSIES